MIWGQQCDGCTLQNAPQARAAYLPIRSGDEAEELIDVPDVEPVGVELHGCLHPLREEEIPHGPGHPPAAEPGGHEWGDGSRVRGTSRRHTPKNPAPHLGKLLPIRMRPSGYSLPPTVTGGLTSRLPKESRLEASFSTSRAT